MNHLAQPGNHRAEPIDLSLFSLFFVGAACLSVLTANPFESLFSILQLVILLRCYWRQNLPPVALLLFLIPWLEISTAVFEANLRDLTLNDMLHGTGQSAYWLSAIGLYAVHFGFYPFFDSCRSSEVEQLKEAASRLSLNKLMLAYFAIGPASDALAKVLGWGSSLYQLVTYVNGISVVILAIICLRQILLDELNRRFVGFCLVVLFLSFYSFFSEWRFLFFSLFLAFATIAQLTKRFIVRFLCIGFIFGNIIFLWQGIKPIYRAYLTGQETLHGGIQSQSVRQSRADALTKFISLSSDFYAGDLSADGFKADDSNGIFFNTLRRVGYLEFMSLTLNHVPAQIDHQGGNLLKSNASYALLPRIINPNKGTKDDGAKVEKYTGFMVSEHASFSLGHYVEHYIDFGKIGCILFLILYGLIGGTIYGFIMSRQTALNPLLAFAIAFVVLQNWGSYQNDSIWIYGTTIFGLICHLWLFRPIYAWLQKFTQAQTHPTSG